MDTIKKKRKKWDTLFTAGMAMAMVLMGCQKEFRISETDALEIALDQTGLLAKEIQHQNVQQNPKGFMVTLDTSSGELNYEISLDGRIQSRNFGKKSQNPDSAISSQASSQSTAQKNSSAPSSWSAQEQQMIELALRHVGASQEDVSDLNVTSADGAVEVRFRYGDLINIVIINPATSTVIATRFE